MIPSDIASYPEAVAIERLRDRIHTLRTERDRLRKRLADDGHVYRVESAMAVRDKWLFGAEDLRKAAATAPRFVAAEFRARAVQIDKMARELSAALR